MARKKKRVKRVVKEVAAPPVEEVKEEKTTEAIKSEDAEELIEGMKISLPEQHTLVYGGPILKGIKHPLGFSVTEALDGSDGVKGREDDFGVGNGVKLHSVNDTPNGKVNTYLIVYY